MAFVEAVQTVLTTSVPEPKRRWRKLAIVSLSVIVLVLAGISWWWAVGGAASFEPRTVADLLAADSSLKPAEATEELCADPQCVEGWRTDVGNYLRFASVGAAEHWETMLGGDGRRYKTIVLDMREFDLSVEQRQMAIDTLFAWKH